MVFFDLMKTNNRFTPIFTGPLRLCLPGIFLILLSFLCPPSWAGETKKLAILPLSLNAPEQMAYLREGVEDMLSSRLAWEGKVLVLNRSQVRQGTEKISGPFDESLALRVGKELGVQVVLWGSINVIGTNVSLDFSLLDLSENQPVKKFYSQAKGMDDVILRVNEISEEINEKVFGRPKTALASPVTRETSQPKGPEPSPVQSAPGKAPLSLKNFIINPLSPQIIMNAGGFDLAGVWRSAPLPFAIIDIAFGDLDGDGKIETVLLSKNKITICRFVQDRFEIVKEIPGDRWDNYVAVDVADINGTGRPQIFVSNYRSDGLRSKVLSWEQGEYKTIAKDIHYHLRIHQIPRRGAVLLGQQQSVKDPFGGGIHILSWKDGKYVSVEKLKLPDDFTVFNFIYLDINSDGTPEYLYLNPNNRLMVVDKKGKAAYSSSEMYGGSLNMVGGNDTDTYTYMMSEKIYYVPARMVVTSVLDPGKQEIIINKNKGVFTNFLDRIKAYSSGEIFSLSWDGAAMKENWRTQTINDYVANYGVADFKNNGQQQLVVGVVQSSGLPIVSNARSVLFCYDLGAVKSVPK
jgi:TolB-like protein